MNSPMRKPTTYRLTPELDNIITQEAKKLGVSKNALVQVKLAEMFLGEVKNQYPDTDVNPTGTEA